MASRTLTLYRDDSTVQVVYEHVKAVFWTAGNTVLVISQYTGETPDAHRYIHWPRERFCWFEDSGAPAPREGERYWNFDEVEARSTDVAQAEIDASGLFEDFSKGPEGRPCP